MNTIRPDDEGMETTPATCTVRNFSGVCGKPAVVSFAGRSGEMFHECADHEIKVSGVKPAVEVGCIVTVTHIGVEKHGRVVAVRRTRCDVKIATPHGRNPHKVISVPIESVR